MRYVYISIPRTGSKSMSQWLVEHFQGEWHGDHHEWRVPAQYRDFLVFTIVRNPYEIQASGWFFEPVIKSDDQPPKAKSYAEACRNWIAPRDRPVTHKHFVEWSGIAQVFFFAHLPN